MKPFAQSLLGVSNFCVRYRKWLIIKALVKIGLVAAITFW
jgi:hypothetical protein